MHTYAPPQRKTGNASVTTSKATTNNPLQRKAGTNNPLQMKTQASDSSQAYEDKEKPLGGNAFQLKANEAAAPPVKENKTGLPDNLKAGVENLSGFNMDDVKVHYNSHKPAQLQALAYAQGTDIHVAPGQEQHLPHEAWHIVQQKQGRVQATLQMKGNIAVNDDKGLENEADRMGTLANAALISNSVPRSGSRPSTHQTSGKQAVLGKAAIQLAKCTVEGCNEQFKKKDQLDKHVLSHTCQAGECKKRFTGNSYRADRNKHIAEKHKFPKLSQYPYQLGAQGALTHTLVKETVEDKQTFKKFDAKTDSNQNLHSEWKAVKKANINDESKITNSFEDFMDKEKEFDTYYVTHDPHCGICTKSLEASGLPLTYGTNGFPSSDAYGIPATAPKVQQVKDVFEQSKKEADDELRKRLGKKSKEKSNITSGRQSNTRPRRGDNTKLKSESGTEASKGQDIFKFKKDQNHFAKLGLKTQQASKKEYDPNKNKDEDGKKIPMSYLAQAMDVQAESHANLFSKLPEDEGMSREDLKTHLRENPIFKNPYTFDEYVPSDTEEEQEATASKRKKSAPQKNKKNGSGKEEEEVVSSKRKKLDSRKRKETDAEEEEVVSSKRK